MAYENEQFDPESPTPVSSAAQAASRSRSMDAALTQSGDALRASFARNPVIPNAPRQAPSEVYDPDAGAMVPSTSGGGSGIISAAQRMGQSALNSMANVATGYRPDQNYDARDYARSGTGTGTLAAAAGNATPPPAEAGTQMTTPSQITVATSGEPRTALDTTKPQAQTSTRGNYSDTGPVQQATGGYYSGGANPIEQANQRARAELNVMNANERAQQDRNRVAGVAQGQQAQATFDARNKQRADEVDRWQNRNLVEWNLNNNPRLLADYKKTEMNSAAYANANGPVAQAAGINPAATAANTPNPYLQEALAQNEAGSKVIQQQLAQRQGDIAARQGDVAVRAGEQGLVAGATNIEKGKVDLQNAQHVAALHTALSNAKTPDEQKRIGDQILLAAGHQPGPDWVFHPVGGGSITNDMGVSVPQPQGVFAMNTRTGQQMTFGGSNMQQNQPGQLPAGAVKHVDAKGNVAYKLPNGSYVDATGKPV
jgi:hypothetical protein